MEIWCIRHGEATHNVDFKKRGEIAYIDERHINSELTSRGKGQAQRCTLPRKPDIAVSSPLRRALTTAHVVMEKYPDVPLITLDCLREFPNGLHTPNRLFRSQDTWRPDREETQEELAKRVQEFKDWLDDMSHKCTSVAVFGHTSYFEAFLGTKTELPHALPFVTNWSDVNQ